MACLWLLKVVSHLITLQPLRLEGYYHCLGRSAMNLAVSWHLTLCEVLTLNTLHLSCCNFVGMFSISKSWMSSTLTFVWLFELLNKLKVKLPCEHTIILEKLPISCHHFRMIFSISTPWKNLMLTFVWPFCPFKLGQDQIMQMGGRQQHLVNTMCSTTLPASYCKLTEMFSTSPSWKSLTLTFVWPFWTFNLDLCQMAIWR